MKTQIFKRTFEAKRYPAGSLERAKLNENNITSEYMPSYKWAIKGENFSSTARSKKEAEEKAFLFACKFKVGDLVKWERANYPEDANSKRVDVITKCTGDFWGDIRYYTKEVKDETGTPVINRDPKIGLAYESYLIRA